MADRRRVRGIDCDERRLHSKWNEWIGNFAPGFSLLGVPLDPSTPRLASRRSKRGNPRSDGADAARRSLAPHRDPGYGCDNQPETILPRASILAAVGGMHGRTWNPRNLALDFLWPRAPDHL